MSSIFASTNGTFLRTASDGQTGMPPRLVKGRYYDIASGDELSLVLPGTGGTLVSYIFQEISAVPCDLIVMELDEESIDRSLESR